jgi:predicted NBD/HSP70 family sugar kinase
MKILVIDVGGNNIKLITSERDDRVKIPSGSKRSADELMAQVKQTVADWYFDCVSIGTPGPVKQNRLVLAPINLGPGWLEMDFDQQFDKPVKLINDAAMQALGSYEGGEMLFMGLGTGLGTAMISRGHVLPLEVAHLPYQDGESFEHFVGKEGMKRLGKKQWNETVADVVQKLKDALCADYVVLGGGNAKKLKDLPEGARLGHNSNAFEGGFRLWRDETIVIP